MLHAMQLALFDLDNTLLDADSDLEWGELLAAEGAMDLQRTREFHARYHDGTLDIDAFLEFQLAPLAKEPRERLLAWRARFLERRIEPRLSLLGRARVRDHADRGHEIVLITATNRFLTEPIAQALAIPHLLATRPEVQNERFTGRVDGVPCYREGKIRHLEDWLAARALHFEDVRESWFYSDSHNDIPLLGRVDHPIAIDPDASLRAHALERGWPIESWRSFH
jgi:HAD superfamily hydrolase (TIGR01490 family)